MENKIVICYMNIRIDWIFARKCLSAQILSLFYLFFLLSNSSNIELVNKKARLAICIRLIKKNYHN